jgi:hypothetical protein
LNWALQCDEDEEPDDGDDNQDNDDVNSREADAQRDAVTSSSEERTSPKSMRIRLMVVLSLNHYAAGASI